MPHIMIVEGRFYTELANEMAQGAIDALEAAGATYERVSVAGACEHIHGQKVLSAAGRHSVGFHQRCGHAGGGQRLLRRQTVGIS